MTSVGAKTVSFSVAVVVGGVNVVGCGGRLGLAGLAVSATAGFGAGSAACLMGSAGTTVRVVKARGGSSAKRASPKAAGDACKATKCASSTALVRAINTLVGNAGEGPGLIWNSLPSGQSAALCSLP